MKLPTKDCLVVMFDRIGPYHFARLRTVGKLMPTAAIEISAVDKTYAWDLLAGEKNFRRITLFNSQDTEPRSVAELSRRINSTLDECRPTAVAIPGWSTQGALCALRWCSIQRVPVVMMSDSTSWDHRRFFWKEWVKRQLLRLSSAGLVAGTPHADYVTSLGLSPDRVFTGYDVVDNAHFSQGADQARAHDTELRIKHGLPPNYFLASARFVEKKNLFRIVEAYAKYRQRWLHSKHESEHKKAWQMVLVGDGPLRRELHHKIAELGLTAHVLMQGFKQYDELPIFYGLAKVFIHASTTDQWGLVVNEAMASGLPVLVSNRCGCAMNLVKEGVTGHTFDPWNTDEIAELMFDCARQPDRLSRMGRAGRELIAEWDLDRFAANLSQAVEKAVKVRPPKATAMDRLLIKFLLKRNGEAA